MATGGSTERHSSESCGSEDLHELQCQPCQKDGGELREAVGMCRDCQEYLCRRCYDVHTVPTPCKSHELVDKQEIVQGKVSVAVRDRCTEQCDVHEGEIIKYNCTSHARPGCSVCVTLNHRNCNSVTYIPHASKDLAANVEYQEALKTLNHVQKMSKNISDSATVNANLTANSGAEVVRDLQEFRNEVIATLDRTEAAIVKTMKARESKWIEKMTKLSDKWQQINKEMEEIISKTDSLSKQGQNCSSYTLLMKLKNRLSTVEEQIRDVDIEQALQTIQFKFLPNKSIIKDLEQPDALGTLSGGNITGVKAALGINVNTFRNEHSCKITGLVLLAEDTVLVLVDNRNGQIKAVDLLQNGKVIFEREMPSAPWDITAIGEHQAAATLPYAEHIGVFTLLRKDHMIFERRIDVNANCYGIDCKDGKLAVSFFLPHCVKVLDLYGTVLHNIPTESQGLKIFNYPAYVTYGKDNTHLYVSNRYSNNVVCIDLDGTIVASYSDKTLQRPRKVIVNECMGVFVCGENTHNVHQISPKCNRIKLLLSQSDGLDNPISISYSDKRNCLYVGMDHCNIVQVYKMEWGV